MSRPFWTARHVETLAQLPEKLERGRAYFVDDENYIVIDYGRGPIIYGGKPGPSGIPGEPLPQLQGQIDYLTEASIRLSSVIKKINDMRIRDTKAIKSQHEQDISQLTAKHDSDMAELTSKHDLDIAELTAKHNEDLAGLTAKHDGDLAELTARHESELAELSAKHDGDIESVKSKAERELNITSEDLQVIMSERDERLADLIHNNTEAVMKMMKFTYNKFTQIDKAIFTLFKLLASLYPNADIDTRPYEDSDENTLTAGETLNTDSGSYKVRRAYKDSESGAYTVELEVLTNAEYAYVQTLNEGDTFTDESGHVWTVREHQLSDTDGVILISEVERNTLAENLRIGDTVTAGEKSYTVTGVSSDNGTISLLLSES